jgi:hypothetical protein
LILPNPGFRQALFSAVALGFWGSAQCAPQPTPTSQSTSNDGQVYRAFLATIVGGQQTDTLYVAERTAVFHTSSLITREDFRRRYDGFPSALAGPLEAASSPPRPTETLSLPYPIHVVSSKELNALFGNDPQKGWEGFHRRYPRARSYFAFSPIVYSTNGADALFWYEWYCGSLCAGGEAVWVSRDSQGRWQFRQKVLFWIS